MRNGACRLRLRSIQKSADRSRRNDRPSAFARELGDNFLDGGGFVQLDQFAATPAGRRLSWPQRIASGKSSCCVSVSKRFRSVILLVEFAEPLSRRGNNGRVSSLPSRTLTR